VPADPLALSDRASDLWLQATGSAAGWHCAGRQTLSTEDLREDVSALLQSCSSIGNDALVKTLTLPQLAQVLRLLLAGGQLPDAALLKAVTEKTRSQLTAGTASSADLDASAAIALAACEAGSHADLGTGIVQQMISTGAARSDGAQALGGAGAAALSLAAAICEQLDTTLLESLLIRCSAKEVDLEPAMLGDIRLATTIAGSDIILDMDPRALSFYRTLCQDAVLDDPRPPAEEPDVEGAAASDILENQLSLFEQEVSRTLRNLEVVHSRTSTIGGFEVQLSALAPPGGRSKCAIFCEEPLIRSVYLNTPSQRTAWQSWKYKVVANHGFQVFPLTVDKWKTLATTEDRSTYLREVLAGEGWQ